MPPVNGTLRKPKQSPSVSCQPADQSLELAGHLPRITGLGRLTPRWPLVMGLCAIRTTCQEQSHSFQSSDASCGKRQKGDDSVFIAHEMTPWSELA
jgi:hypothetical protein